MTEVRLDLNRWKRIEQIGVCASKDQARVILTAVNVQPGNDNLTITATDSYRLATTIIEADCESSDSFLIPAKVTKDIRVAVSKIGELGKNPEVFVKVTNTEAKVTALDTEGTPRFTQSVRLIDGNFPHYESFFPKMEDGFEGLTKSDLIGFIEKYGDLNGLTERSRKDDLLAEANRLKIGPAYASFNAEYVSSMAVASDAKDHQPVEFRLRGPLQPISFTTPADPQFRGLVMPVRT